MKKNVVQLLGMVLSLVILIVFIRFIILLRPRESSQGDIQPLEERLIQLGIPVKSFVITKQSPLEIEIVLQSKGNEDKIGQDDLWDKFLTEREIDFAYLNYGIEIESYRLILVNANGDTMYDGTIFLNPVESSQNLTEAPSSTVDNGKTKDILEDNLDLQGLKLLALDVPMSYTTGDNSKLVTLDLSTGTSAGKIDSSQINAFIMNLRPQFEDINSRFGTRIVLVHLQIMDSNNELLVKYMEDIETGRQSFWVADNFEGGWYSQPVPVPRSEPQETSTPVTAPIATSTIPTVSPAPITPPSAYPPPSTSSPYP